MKKFLCIALAAMMMFCMFAGCGSSGNTDKGGDADAVIQIGSIGPTTGDAAIYGSAVKAGAEIAVEEINAAGGFGGTKIEFQFQDDAGDGTLAVDAYNELMDWGMDILVGAVTTGSALTVSEEVYKDRVFALTPSASSADVPKGKDNVFQLCFQDPAQGVAAADYMAANFKDAKIAVIYRNDDAYSQGIFEAFKTELAKYEMTTVYEGTFTADTATDFSVQLTAAQAAEADMVFLPIYYQPASVIFAQADAMGYKPTFFGVDGMDGILTLDNFKTELAEGVTVQSPFSADATDDATVAFVKAYEEKTGEKPNQFAADAYDCVYAIKAAYEKAECTADMTAEELCTKLMAVFTSADFSYDGLTGSGMTWSKDGAVSKAPNIYIITDGKYVLTK